LCDQRAASLLILLHQSSDSCGGTLAYKSSA
jgi:hypothetical protein